MLLHGAIALVLGENPEGLTAREIAEKINERGLYQRKDGADVPPSQISARIHNHPRTFTKKGPKYYLDH